MSEDKTQDIQPRFDTKPTLETIAIATFKTAEDEKFRRWKVRKGKSASK